MTSTDVHVTVPEAARRLGLPGGEVYQLVFSGALSGGPASNGAVYVSAADLDRYLVTSAGPQR